MSREINFGYTQSSSFYFSNVDEENSLIIWDRDFSNEGNETNDQIQENITNEDFIEIDIIPDSEISIEDDEDEGLPNNETVASESLETNDDDVEPINSSNNSLPFQGDQISFQTEGILSDEFSRTNTNNINQLNTFQICQKLPENTNNNEIFKLNDELRSRLEYINLENLNYSSMKLPNFCYMEGIVNYLKVFGKFDSNMKEKLCNSFDDCQCYPDCCQQISWSKLILQHSGILCKPCSMTYIINKMNNTLLSGVAITEFVSVADIITIINKDYVGDDVYSSVMWFRKWALDHLRKESLISIVYTNNNNENKLNIVLITGIDDTGFQLNNSSRLSDEEIEKLLMSEEVVEIPKTILDLPKSQTSDFLTIFSHPDHRFAEMNVLGQIVATFRERSSEHSINFYSEHVHNVRVPNRHLNGAFIVSRALPEPVSPKYTKDSF